MEQIIISKVRLANYAAMIKNINRAIGQCSYTDHKIDDFVDDMINRVVNFKANLKENTRNEIDSGLESGWEMETPLRLIYDYHQSDIYARLIMCITEDSFAMSECWGYIYENIVIFSKDMDIASAVVKRFKESKNVTEGYRFIFWALMILTVDKIDAEEHLSLICDYAKMLDITDDEFEDIIRTIKIIYNQEKSYSFKTETVPEYFSKLFDLMKIHVAL